MEDYEKILLDLGDRGKAYFKEYVNFERKKKVVDLNGFKEVFAEYIKNMPIKQNGYKSISLASFRKFLLVRQLTN